MSKTFVTQVSGWLNASEFLVRFKIKNTDHILAVNSGSVYGRLP